MEGDASESTDSLLIEEEREKDSLEETNDLIQMYFRSMGDISILTKSEERELIKIKKEDL